MRFLEVEAHRTDVCGDDFNDIVCFSFQFKHERRRSQIFEQTAKAS